MLDFLRVTWDVTQGLLLILLCVLLYQVVKQQGRLLLRLDRIDGALGIAEPGSEPDQSFGLAVGTAIPDFHLPDLDGRMVSPEDLQGKRVLLIHWGPGCGFCELLAPDLARLQEGLIARGARLVLASRDSAEANRQLSREYGLECLTLLMQEDDPMTFVVFRNQGTPAAYLLDDQARIARPLAVGGDAILALAREIIGEGEGHERKPLPGERPLSESRIERDGLKPGTIAPTFRLADLDGEMIDLADYRGRPVLLIFTDPHCGPCEELAPQLTRRQHDCRDGGLELILVGRGDVAENRLKADHFGFDFPVVVQERWKLSREYGIFAVPVAFLIGEDGVIASPVARGVAEILALVPRGLASANASNARSVRG